MRHIQYLNKPIGILLLSAAIFTIMIWPSEYTPITISPLAPSVHSQQLKQGDFRPTINLHGKVTSNRHATIKATVNADVDQTPYQVGDFVKKGEALLKLNSNKIYLSHAHSQASLQQLEANITAEKNIQAYQKKALKEHLQLLDLVQKEANRQQYLYHHQQTSLASLEKAQQEYLKESLATMSLSQQVKNHGQTLKQLQAQYQQRQTQLQKTHIDVGRLTITAPFSGYLTQLYVHEGDRVATQTALLKLYDPQSLEIHSQIPLQYAQQISGDNTTATTQYQKQIIPLNLTRISKHIEATQSTVNAIFHPNQTFSPPIGQWLEITIALPPVAQSFIVPEQAIYHNNTVYKIDQNTLKAIPVTMMGHAHQKAHHMVIVSKSLHHGDTILTTPLPNATTGLQVMPSEDNTP